LLCEDNNFNVKLIEKILFDSPFKNNISLDIAYNGKIGGEMVKNCPLKYDLILMDLQMPEMNGLETSEYVRKQLKLNIPIIAMTANLCSIERKRCIENGINGYLTKPFKKQEFFKCFNNLLKNKINRVKGLSKNIPNKIIQSPLKHIDTEFKNINDKINKKKLGTNSNLSLNNIQNRSFYSSKSLLTVTKEKEYKIINETNNNFVKFENLKNYQISKIHKFNFNINEKDHKIFDIKKR